MRRQTAVLDRTRITLLDPAAERTPTWRPVVNRPAVLSRIESGNHNGDGRLVQVIDQIIYVELLDEGVDAWRPVTATEERRGVYRLPHRRPEDEQWAFPPGSLVRCEQRDLGDGSALVAIALA